MPADEYKTIELLLKDRIGLESSVLGPKAVEQAASERMRLLGINAVSSYAALISTSAKELEALIELVVIPETWFFRDREPFVFLAHFIRTEWKSEHAQEKLRILSAPCATGEEPYSIVMTCLDCGLKQDQFVVDAADINVKFLHKAQKAVYGRNSFRGTETAFRKHYFISNGNEYSLNPEVRERVHFFKANIIEPDSLPGFAHYNIVFCRNLLIYLHDQARSKTIAIIERLLAPGGLLFIGHAEASPSLMEIYETVNHHGSFALRKPIIRQIKKKFPGAGQKNESLLLSVGAPSVAADSPDEQPGIKAESAMTDQPITSAVSENIERATMLANQGRLKEADEACHQIIHADKRNALAHFLLGLISEAQDDNSRAEECFNRAIYLDANFAEAILHLAMLKEQCGDSAGADLFRRRAASINNQIIPSK